MAEKQSKEKQTVEQVVRQWHERIATAKRFLKGHSEHYEWEMFIRWFKGEYGIQAGNVQVPVINEVFAFVDADVSLMSFKNPYIAVNPRLSGTRGGAAILEAWLNHKWRELGIKYETDLELIDGDLVGHGWHKTGFNVKAVGTDEQIKIEEEKLYSMRVSWRDVVFDLGSKKPPKDCRWMAHRIIKPIDDVKEIFPQLNTLSGIRHPYVSEKEYKDLDFKDDVMYGVLWELWDAKKKEILLLAEDFLKFLDKKPWPKHRDEFPFRMLEFYRVPDEPYPLSPIGNFKDQVIEEQKLFAMALNHVKRWNRQAFMKKGTLSESEMSKYKMGLDGSIIEHTSDNIQAHLRFADYGQLPPDIYMLLDRIAQQARSVNGQPEIERGGVTKTPTRTFGELKMIRQGGRNRSDRRVNAYENHLNSIARDLLSELRSNFDVEQVAKIVKETPAEIVDVFTKGDPDLRVKYNAVSGTLEFNPEDIKGEYDATIAAGSTLPLDRETRTLLLRDVLELAAALPSPVPPFLQEIIVELLRGYDIPGLEDAFLEQEGQAAEAMAKGDEAAEVEKDKVFAEAEKRGAQAAQIDSKTKIQELEAVKNSMNGGEPDAV